MGEQVNFTLGGASKATGKSKSTISKAISSGRLSVMSKEGGAFQISASELFRVFPIEQAGNVEIERLETPNSTPETGILEAQLEGVRGELEQVRSERDDLRRRLDMESEERRKLTALLTDQRTRQPEPPSQSPQEGRGGRLGRAWAILTGKS
jgi:hypothetical protein